MEQSWSFRENSVAAVQKAIRPEIDAGSRNGGLKRRRQSKLFSFEFN
jgi:hypothetical protein